MQTIEQKKSPYTKMPNKMLGQKPVSKQFIDRGAVDFHQACDYVWRLPYGRTQDSELSVVLTQGRGTCSSKHGLLKIFADELSLEVDLYWASIKCVKRTHQVLDRLFMIPSMIQYQRRIAI